MVKPTTVAQSIADDMTEEDEWTARFEDMAAAYFPGVDYTIRSRDGIMTIVFASALGEDTCYDLEVSRSRQHG